MKNLANDPTSTVEQQVLAYQREEEEKGADMVHSSIEKVTQVMRDEKLNLSQALAKLNYNGSVQEVVLRSLSPSGKDDHFLKRFLGQHS